MAPSLRTLFSTPSPDAIEASNEHQFCQHVNKKRGLNLRNYWELHAWSVKELNSFWEDVWDFCGIIGEREDGVLFDASYPVDVPNPRMIRAKLNMAENFLLAHPLARSSSKAIISVVEPDPTISPDSPAYLPSTHLRTLTFAQLYDEVHVFSNALKAMGVGPGDRVVAFSPSNAECVVACLATAALGGIWSSCPTEFGVTAVLERFQQIEPKVLLTADRNRYAGKAIYIYDKLVAVAKELPSVQTIIVVGHMEKDREPREKFPADRLGKDWMTYGAALKKGVTKEKDIKFHRGSAMAPVYVLYSSGTTGKPKAIVHTVGGMVLSSKMSNTFHNGFTKGDILLQFSTLGWMMWNYAVSSLATGVCVVSYDGSPLFPTPILWKLVDEYKVNCLGISPRYLQVLDTATPRYLPNQHHSLKSLKQINIAGSVLSADMYNFIRDNIGPVWICNGSGGTDICNLFVGGVRSLPVYHAEIQAPALGMDLQAWDDDGNPVKDGQGNMVITNAFPNMPLTFWGVGGDARYKAAYFEEYPRSKPVWYQGDWIELSSLTGGCTIFGRSDGVLNPGGVRFGSSELYAIVEDMQADIDDCIAIGQRLPDGDERVVLFVTPANGASLSAEVITKIKKRIASELSPRHVPAKILYSPRIPYTTNGKRLEVATKKLLNGTKIEDINLSSAEDPKILRQFIDHPELRLPPTASKL